MPRGRGMSSDRYYDCGYDDDLGGLAPRQGDQMVLQGDAVKRGAFLGPTVRETRPGDKNLQGQKWVQESDGHEYLYNHVKNIGVGGQGQ